MKILLLLLISATFLSITIFAQSNVASVYPNSADYWTGTTDSLTKTDPCEIRAWDNEVGWMMFDVSSIPQNSVINSVTLWAYISTFAFPHLSVTPLPYNGVTASA